MFRREYSIHEKRIDYQHTEFGTRRADTKSTYYVSEGEQPPLSFIGTIDTVMGVTAAPALLIAFAARPIAGIVTLGIYGAYGISRGIYTIAVHLSRR